MPKYWFSFTPNPADSAGLAPTFLNFLNADGTTSAPPGITQIHTGTGIYSFDFTPTQSVAFRIFAATTGIDANLRYVVGSLELEDSVGTTVIGVGNTSIALGSSNFALGTTNLAFGTTNFAIGTSLIAQGNTLFALGSTNVAIGTTLTAIGTSLVAQGNTLFAIGTSGVAQGVINSTLIGQLGLSVAAFSSSLGALSAFIGDTTSVYGSNLADPVTLFGYGKRVVEFLEGNQTFNKTTGAWSIYSRSYATLLITKSLVNNAAGVTRY